MFNPLMWYRLARFLYLCKVPILPNLITYLIRFIFACYFPHTCITGKGLVLGYGGLGIVIHGDSEIGEDVHLDQQVTIGGNATEYGVPQLGNHIYIGAGAKILGPIKIGDHVVVGANSVVLSDVPSNTVVGGIPARTLKSGITLNTFLYHRKS